ncbi:HAD-IIA family hydrolase [Nocardioides hungaricus]
MLPPSEDFQTDRSTGSLVAEYDGVICDLDGVVYRGDAAVPGAVATLRDVLASGVGVVFATNNASRSPEEVSRHLREIGVEDPGWSVVTSSQSAAAYLAKRLPPGASVLAVGGPGVSEALAEAGLGPVRVPDVADTTVVAIVQGLGMEVTWRELAAVGNLVRRGVPWVATNRDLTFPTADGPAPGNGALVAAVRTATTVDPHVTGKPGPALFDLARARLDTRHDATLVCGDRLDTDIAGANAAHLDSLFVLSGASRLQELAFAPDCQRPTYVARDLTGLLKSPLRLRQTPGDLVEISPDGFVHVREGDSGRDLLQAVVTTAWAALDDGHTISSNAAMWRGLERQLGVDSAPIILA